MLDEAQSKTVREVLAAWGLEDAEVLPIAIGLINRTFEIKRSTGTRFILQHVNPIFTPRVHEDIEAVTAWVTERRAGVIVPRLVRTNAGALFHEHEGRVWRVLTFIDGDTKEKVTEPALAFEAGALLGRFHRALAGLEHEFKNKRLGVHDTKRHLAVLAEALEEHRDAHPRYGIVAPLCEEILAEARALPELPKVADRIVHGDPKISNLMFEHHTGRAIAIVDLDTLAHMPLFLELGDALRSWTNPLGEDHTDVEVSLPIFAKAVDGYAKETKGWILEDEWRALVPATRTIMVELAARFAADALHERYFGWNPRKFATRGEHNELRARGQLALARSMLRVQAEADALVERAFAP
ncbi:phosphotransferase [Myxococcota bacterium]|nr:phosphotransferase [Myxococcota bacterium]